MEINSIFEGDILEGLSQLEGNSIDCCVTSPPYWNLRDYKMENQLGMEKTPEEYISKMVTVFHEVKRVLRDIGTLWLNVGDSYAAQGKNRTEAQAIAKSTLRGSTDSQLASLKQASKIVSGLKPKDLIGIPWMLAFALRADGWYLRSDIIWNKPNCMPESVTDRPTKSHEYIFLLSKSEQYWYDHQAIKTRVKESSLLRLDQNVNNQSPAKSNGNMKAVMGGQANIREFRDKQRGHSKRHQGFNERWDQMTTSEQASMGANKRSVWTIAPAQFKGAHFATFPPELIVDCIKAGCPSGGLVLDPFMGSGTTAIVARKLNRNYLGIELNPQYVAMANHRIQSELGLFI